MHTTNRRLRPPPCRLNPHSNGSACVFKRMCDVPTTATHKQAQRHRSRYTLFIYFLWQRPKQHFTLRDNLRLRLWYCNAKVHHVLYECAMSSRVRYAFKVFFYCMTHMIIWSRTGHEPVSLKKCRSSIKILEFRLWSNVVKHCIELFRKVSLAFVLKNCKNKH